MNLAKFLGAHVIIIIIIIIIIIVNLFIVDDKNTIKNIFACTNVALNAWLRLYLHHVS